MVIALGFLNHQQYVLTDAVKYEYAAYFMTYTCVLGHTCIALQMYIYIYIRIYTLLSRMSLSCFYVAKRFTVPTTFTIFCLMTWREKKNTFPHLFGLSFEDDAENKQQHQPQHSHSPRALSKMAMKKMST